MGSNTNFLTLSPVQLSNSGGYYVVVTNAFGTSISPTTTVTVLPKHFSNLATQLWTVAPGAVDYISNDNNQRSAGYDPIFQRVVLVSRTPTNGMHLLDAASGADLGDMDISLILAGTPPGFFALNNCGVADDGVVYAANLILSGNSDSFVIYRWDGATNAAAMGAAYVGNPLSGAGTLGRIGDTMAVRGAGANTEILCSFRTGTNIAIFNTTDGINFNFNLVAVTNLPDSGAGLGVAWGPGNTFYVKSTGFNLRQIAYDLPSNSGGVIGSFNNSLGPEAPIGVDIANNYLATIGIGEIPQNLPLYDLALNDGNSISALVDRDLFGANNPNGNGTGTISFDVAGGRIFALDSNNGLLALKYAPRLYIAPQIHGGVVTWTGPGTLQSASVVTGPYADIVATSPYTNTAASQLFFRVRR